MTSDEGLFWAARANEAEGKAQFWMNLAYRLSAANKANLERIIALTSTTTMDESSDKRVLREAVQQAAFDALRGEL